MAGRELDIPSFDFSGFYYPQILDSLILFKRQNVPELTDESDFEPFIQMLRAVALVGHLNNTLIDLIANESTLPTAQLPETVRNMLRLIGFELRPGTPSGVDMVFQFARTFAADTEVISRAAQTSTEKQGTEPLVFVEVLDPVTVGRTDRIGAVFSDEGGVFSDHTASAVAGSDFVALAAPAVGDKVYFGHLDIMWDVMAVTVTAGIGDVTGVWEFFDGEFGDVAPTSVTNIGGGQLQFDLTSLLGLNNRAGATVRVFVNDTGAFQDVTSQWNGAANIATTGLLGQSSPSVDASDYTVGSQWTEIDPITDGTAGLTTSGDVEFALPQDESRNWTKGEINGADGQFIRFRVITVTTPTALTLNLIRIDTGKQYLLAPAVQGRSVSDNPLGSSTGAPNQRFTTSRDHFILNSQIVRVDGVVWTPVLDFLESAAQDEHYVVELGENDRADIVFGDGVTGKIPPIGQGNIRCDFRFGAENDGNVGPNTLIVDKTGLTFVDRQFNPRQAVGWAEAQAASPASLEKAKIEGPASLRTQEVALGPDDLENLTTRFIDANGSSPFGRARAIEEGFGPKTVELVVVARGGGQATLTQLSELDTYFNGDKTVTPPIKKRFVANQTVTSVNFDPRPIDVTATVTAPTGFTSQQIVNRLLEILQPEALRDDGVTFLWEFGAEVPRSRIIHEIFETDPGISKVVLTEPATDTQLNSRELPTSGTLSITIIEG